MGGRESGAPTAHSRHGGDRRARRSRGVLDLFRHLQHDQPIHAWERLRADPMTREGTFLGEPRLPAQTMPLHSSRLSLALLLTLAACGDPGDADGTADAGVALDAGDAGADDDAGDQPNTRDPFDPGPWTPAHVTTALTDADREGRTFAVEIWYPSDAPLPEAAASVATFADGAEADALQALLDAAPAECPTRVTGAARGAAPIASPRPVVAMSHCSTAAASALSPSPSGWRATGLVVVAPDHAGRSPSARARRARRSTPPSLRSGPRTLAPRSTRRSAATSSRARPRRRCVSTGTRSA